jgi:hypothetical protein
MSCVSGSLTAAPRDCVKVAADAGAEPMFHRGFERADLAVSVRSSPRACLCSTGVSTLLSVVHPARSRFVGDSREMSYCGTARRSPLACHAPGIARSGFVVA